MKKGMIIFGAILFVVTILSSCGGKSNSSGNNSGSETNTCASCGASFDWACTTDVFGECVCSEGCSGRWNFNKKWRPEITLINGAYSEKPNE